jgi:hypothetical protein
MLENVTDAEPVQLARIGPLPAISIAFETLPEAPAQEPQTEPESVPTAPPAHRPDLDPFNPDWPPARAEPQPKA